jgi:cathepsin B
VGEMIFLLSILLFATSKEFCVTNELVDEINLMKTSWTAQHNRFSNITVSDARKLMGTHVGLAKKGANPIQIKKQHRIDVPTSFDWRDHTDCESVHNVLNQEQCGSCWAFSATEALSG